MAKSDCALLLLPSIHLIPGGFKMLGYEEEGLGGVSLSFSHITGNNTADAHGD